MNVNSFSKCRWELHCQKFCIQEFQKSWQRNSIFSITMEYQKSSTWLKVRWYHTRILNKITELIVNLSAWQRKKAGFIKGKNGPWAEHHSKCNSFVHINREYQVGEKSLIFRLSIQAVGQPLTPWMSAAGARCPVLLPAPQEGSQQHGKGSEMNQRESLRGALSL